MNVGIIILGFCVLFLFTLFGGIFLFSYLGEQGSIAVAEKYEDYYE